MITKENESENQTNKTKVANLISKIKTNKTNRNKTMIVFGRKKQKQDKNKNKNIHVDFSILGTNANGLVGKQERFKNTN